MLPNTFSARIALVFSLAVAALLLCSAWLIEKRTLVFHEQEVERRLDAVALAVLEEARAAFDGSLSVAEFAKRTNPLVEQSRLRITLIRPDGEVVHDSERPPPLANHGDRAEFIAAMREGRGTSHRNSATTSIPTVYVARRVDGPAGVSGAVRIGGDLELIGNEMAFLEHALLFGAGGVLLLGILFAVALSRWLARPLEQIAVEATAVAKGEESGIIRVNGPREVRRLAGAINDMAEELKAQLAAIESSRAETASILESLHEGVVAVSRHERLLRMNDAAARLLGLSEPLRPGEQLWKAVRFPELEIALRGVITEGSRTERLDAASPRDDGTMLALTVSPLADGRGAVAILSDVTALRRLAKVRSDFVANVSHEMRTPLAVILGALETLTDPTLGDADQRKFLDMARQNADRMKNIVEDLLELSKIESEGDAMTFEPLAIDLPVRSAASALQFAADAKGITLAIDALPSPPIQVNGNFKRLEQVFTNLIDNAIKYTPTGGRVDVRIRAGDRDVTIDVADTGIGIPAHSLQRVFERFYRVDKGRSRDMGGTGLGLAIVKHATRAHGGRVSVRSEEGHGTTFSVVLPRVEAVSPLRAPVGDRD